jgi:hypothetical protein
LIATTFTGNVPDFDIIASNERGRHISVQVKSISEPSWQIGNISKYVDIEFRGHTQIVNGIQPSPVEYLVYVLVKLGKEGTDRFFIRTWEVFCEILAQFHTEYLARHDGVRLKKWDSLRTAFSVKHISQFENRWDVVEKMLE